MASGQAPDARVPELLDALAQAIALQKERGELFWVEWLEKSRKLIEADDFYGVEHLLKGFGGMGSLGDISEIHPSTKEAALNRVLERIYEIADELRRERYRREAI